MLQLSLRVCFAHLFVSEGPVCHQNLISSKFYHPRPLQKFHLNPFITFWVILLSNKQTDKQTNTTKNTRSTRKALTSLAEADHYPHIARKPKSFQIIITCKWIMTCYNSETCLDLIESLNRLSNLLKSLLRINYLDYTASVKTLNHVWTC